jgi:TPP-dependent pyruvate/acetoin dehydrogenase alpha subunit
VAGTYRGHGHALAQGTDPEPLIAEMLGRATGVCGGRAGSMNVIDLQHGLVGCYGIVGGSIAAALGAGMSAQRQGRVAVCFFGDGATNQAYFHECLNFAAVRSLPVLFVCENNLYAEFTPMADATAGADIAGRARAYGIPSAVVDGNDLWAVRDAAAEAIGRARRGDGPTLLECRTYRHYGHSKGDPAPYRTKEEVEEWLERDPLKLARPRLLEQSLTEQQVSAVEQAVTAQVEQAIENALAAPYPDPVADAATEFRV